MGMKTRRRRSQGRTRPCLQRTSANPQVGVAWYTREQWAAVRAVASDPENLEATYEAWVTMAEHALQELRQTGLRLEKVPIEAASTPVKADVLFALVLTPGRQQAA